MEATMGNTNVRQTNILEKIVLSRTFWALAVLFLFAYPIIRSYNRQLPDALPVYGQLPQFQFTDENGKAYGSFDLQGKVYVANFIFTSCQTSCPILLKKIQTIQHRMRGVVDRAAIVSITVDPGTDTSDVLFQKARELKPMLMFGVS